MVTLFLRVFWGIVFIGSPALLLAQNSSSPPFSPPNPAFSSTPATSPSTATPSIPAPTSPAPSAVASTPDHSAESVVKEFMRKMTPEMRLKLIELSNMPPEAFRAALEQWPGFQKLTPEAQDKLLKRFEEIKSHQRLAALDKAKEYGLALTPEQETDFVTRYQKRRVEEEKKILEVTKPLREQMEQTLKAEMIKEFGK